MIRTAFCHCCRSLLVMYTSTCGTLCSLIFLFFFFFLTHLHQWYWQLLKCLDLSCFFPFVLSAFCSHFLLVWLLLSGCQTMACACSNIVYAGWFSCGLPRLVELGTFAALPKCKSGSNYLPSQIISLGVVGPLWVVQCSSEKSHSLCKLPIAATHFQRINFALFSFVCSVKLTMDSIRTNYSQDTYNLTLM